MTVPVSITADDGKGGTVQDTFSVIVAPEVAIGAVMNNDAASLQIRFNKSLSSLTTDNTTVNEIIQGTITRIVGSETYQMTVVSIEWDTTNVDQPILTLNTNVSGAIYNQQIIVDFVDGAVVDSDDLTVNGITGVTTGWLLRY